MAAPVAHTYIEVMGRRRQAIGGGAFVREYTVAILSPESLASLRRELALDQHPSWVKSTANAAFQAVEDILEALAFDPVPLIIETATPNARAQIVQTEIDGGRVSIGALPVVEQWLDDNPPLSTVREIDDGALNSWVIANTGALGTAVQAMPVDQRSRVIRLMALRRVRGAL